MNSSLGVILKWIWWNCIYLLPVSYDDPLIIVDKNIVSVGPALDPEPNKVT